VRDSELVSHIDAPVEQTLVGLASATAFGLCILVARRDLPAA
jgi:hypothetical protein